MTPHTYVLPSNLILYIEIVELDVAPLCNRKQSVEDVLFSYVLYYSFSTTRVTCVFVTLDEPSIRRDAFEADEEAFRGKQKRLQAAIHLRNIANEIQSVFPFLLNRFIERQETWKRD